ncbi:hypothetical protein BRC81_16620 [Halobacteriales archaeon QS_1_68_20]|nr:MAG: hypothetical protein BRC81_16620 [Halobacteriales archaeon QS_1_68_20]
MFVSTLKEIKKPEDFTYFWIVLCTFCNAISFFLFMGEKTALLFEFFFDFGHDFLSLFFIKDRNI